MKRQTDIPQLVFFMAWHLDVSKIYACPGLLAGLAEVCAETCVRILRGQVEYIIFKALTPENLLCPFF